MFRDNQTLTAQLLKCHGIQPLNRYVPVVTRGDIVVDRSGVSGRFIGADRRIPFVAWKHRGCYLQACETFDSTFGVN